MRFTKRGGVATAALAALICTDALRGDVVKDQSMENYGGGGYVWVDRQVAQTFTPAVGGFVDHVDVYADAWSFGSGFTMQLHVTTTLNGKPDTSNILGQATFPPGTGWKTLPLREQNITLNADALYAIWITGDDPSVADPGIGVGTNWRPDLYTRGVAYKRDTGQDWTPWMISASDGPVADLMFRTFMDTPVPEPATATVLCLPAALLILHRRRN